MAWTSGTTSGYRDALAKKVQFMTSQHVSGVAINSGGSGYSVGDILTIPHAGGLLAATVEVLLETAGMITSVKLRSMGAYSNRVVSATVVANGANYVVGDILEVDLGAAVGTELARLRVATLTGSGVATVTVYEGGGAYTTAPTGTQTTTIVGPAAGVGTGATFTVTMTGLIGTTGAATTGGTGSGATLDLTLTATGWTTLRNRNNFTHNSVTDEKEVVLRGDAGGGDDPIIAFRTYTSTVGVDTYYAYYGMGMTAFNPSLALSAQQDVSATAVANNLPIVPLFNTTMPLWFGANGRHVRGNFQTDGGAVDSYQGWYYGLLQPMGTQVENPFPAVLCGSLADVDAPPDSALEVNTGLSEARRATGFACPMLMFELTTRTWVELANVDVATASNSEVRGIYPGFAGAAASSAGSLLALAGPINFTTEVFRNAGGATLRLIYPTMGSGDALHLPWPMTVESTANAGTQGVLTFVHGQLEGCYWVSGTKADGSIVDPQDTLTDTSGNRYRIFPCAHRRTRYSFYAMKES
jgi:hypothetical protein